MEKDVIKQAGEFIRKNCNADDFLFRISVSDQTATRFAVNAITQHLTGKNLDVRLQVAFGNKTGSASVNQIDESSLQYLIHTAEEIAQFNQPDPEFVESEPAHKLQETNNYAQETEDLTVEDMVAAIKKCVDNAAQQKAVVAGLSEKDLTQFYVTTKNGFEGFDRFSRYSHSMTMKRDHIETKVSKSVKNVNDFSMDAEIAQLNEQFDSLEKPGKIEPQKLPVILRPAAALNFFMFLNWMMDLRNADEGVTPFTNQLGQKFMGDHFTMASVMDDLDLSVPKFNGEGFPTRPITWVKNGVIENMGVTRYYAREKGLEPAFFYNSFIEGGDVSEAEMMKMAGRGLIINRLWYIRMVDRKKGELTGITRDGVLYFENGEIQHSVNNLRFNEIPHDVTHRILALGESVLQETWAKIPTMLIDNFNFVDATTF